MPLQVLIVGQTDRPEAGPIRDWMTDHAPRAALRQFIGLNQALAACSNRATPWLPDLVIVFQAWPDEFSQAEIQQLVQLAPLARLVVCSGAWCESDGRTRDYWPQAVRIPVHSAADRLEGEWKLLSGERSESLPISASRDEVFGFDHADLTAEFKPTILVSSPDHAWSDYIREALQSLGHTVFCLANTGIKQATAATSPPVFAQTVNGHGPAHPKVIIADADPWQVREAALMQLQSDFPNSAIIAVFAMPDATLAMQLQQHRITAVLPKLSSLQQLCDAIARCINPKSNGSTSTTSQI